MTQLIWNDAVNHVIGQPVFFGKAYTGTRCYIEPV